MATQLEIANMALSRIGEGEMADYNENSAAGIVVRRHYDHVRDSLLRMGAWNFAMTRASLDAEEDAPAFGYSYQYALPADLLLLVTCNGIEANLDVQSPYRIEGGFLLTDEATAHITYITNTVTEADFDSLFVTCFVVKLAATIALDISESPAKAQVLLQEFESLELPRARSRDAMEDTARRPFHPADSRFALARSGGRLWYRGVGTTSGTPGGGGIEEPTTTGNFLRNWNGTVGSWVAGVLSSTFATHIAAIFTRDDPGHVPNPGGSGTTRYLREDGTWETPPGAGGGIPEPGSDGTFVRQVTASVGSWVAGVTETVFNALDATVTALSSSFSTHAATGLNSSGLGHVPATDATPSSSRVLSETGWKTEASGGVPEPVGDGDYARSVTGGTPSWKADVAFTDEDNAFSVSQTINANSNIAMLLQRDGFVVLELKDTGSGTNQKSLVLTNEDGLLQLTDKSDAGTVNGTSPIFTSKWGLEGDGTTPRPGGLLIGTQATLPNIEEPDVPDANAAYLDDPGRGGLHAELLFENGKRVITRAYMTPETVSSAASAITLSGYNGVNKRVTSTNGTGVTLTFEDLYDGQSGTIDLAKTDGGTLALAATGGTVVVVGGAVSDLEAGGVTRGIISYQWLDGPNDLLVWINAL